MRRFFFQSLLFIGVFVALSGLPVHAVQVQCTAGCYGDDDACRASGPPGTRSVYHPEGSGNTTTCPETQICCVLNTTAPPASTVTTRDQCNSAGGACTDHDLSSQGMQKLGSCNDTPLTPYCFKTGSGTGGTTPPTTGGTTMGGITLPAGTGLSERPVQDILVTFADWLFGIFGILALIALVISGFQYLTAMGNEKTIETAKSNAKWSVVGIIVALSGVVVIQAIEAMLNANPTYF